MKVAINGILVVTRAELDTIYRQVKDTGSITLEGEGISKITIALSEELQ
jgi:hypothetical protein